MQQMCVLPVQVDEGKLINKLPWLTNKQTKLKPIRML